MNLSNFIPDELISAFGWTIVHSLWQGAVIAIVLSIILVLLSKSSAKIRSYISYAGLIIIVAASIKTYSNYNASVDLTAEIYQAILRLKAQKLIINDSISNFNVSTEELTEILLNRAKGSKELGEKETENMLKCLSGFGPSIDYDAVVSLLVLILPLAGVTLNPAIMGLIYG